MILSWDSTLQFKSKQKSDSVFQSWTTKPIEFRDSLPPINYTFFEICPILPHSNSFSILKEEGLLARESWFHCLLQSTNMHHSSNPSIRKSHRDHWSCSPNLHHSFPDQESNLNPTARKVAADVVNISGTCESMDYLSLDSVSDSIFHGRD